MIPPEDVNPEAWGVEAKARRAAIDLCGRRHIHLQGLHFRGAGLCTDSATFCLTRQL